MTELDHLLTKGQAEICDWVNPCVDKGTRGQAEICDRVNPCGVDNGIGRNM